MSKPGRRYCYCREEEKGFMIQCDGCQLWFHGQCVKVTRKSSMAEQDWYCMWCDQCRNSTKNMIEEQEKMRGDIQKLEGELQDLKAAIKKGDPHCDVGLQKICDGMLAEMDILKREVALKKEEKLSLKENYGKDVAIKEEENLALKKNLDVVLTKVDILEKEFAVKQEELNSVRIKFHEEKELLVKNHDTQLDEAFREIGSSLRQSNTDLQQRLAVKRKRLSLSQPQQH